MSLAFCAAEARQTLLFSHESTKARKNMYRFGFVFSWQIALA
jgi:hypothetical protein